MKEWLESAAAIGAVDELLAGAGLGHGRRATRAGSWQDGERVRRPVGRRVEAPTRVRRSRPVVLEVPGWAEMRWLRAGFSTRQGGLSTVYSEAAGADGREHGEQNLGFTREDERETVAANRVRLAEAVGGRPGMRLATLRQFHGGLIRVLRAADVERAVAGDRPAWRGDGLMSAERGVLLGVQTADCVPVLLVDTKRRAVAAFHAGWRGTLARIVERGVGTMRVEFGSKPKDLVAAIGPAIAGCCFAVGEEVRFEFESQFGYARELFTEVYDSDPVREKYPLLFLTARAPGHSKIGPQIHLDLQEANRRQLLEAGLRAKAITVLGECTACTRLKDGRRRYFSHRAEAGFTGRMMGVVGISAEGER